MSDAGEDGWEMPHSSAKTSSLPIHRIYIFRSLSLLGVAFNFEKKSVRVEELYQRSQLSQFTGVKLTCHSLRSEMDVFSGLWAIFSFDHFLVFHMASCGWKFSNSIYGRSVIDTFAG